MGVDEGSSRQRFDALWHEHSPRVQAYAVRHVGIQDAADIVAETYLVAWRRLDRVPDAALPWLLVTARNVIANRRRTAFRHQQFSELLERVDDAGDEPGNEVAERQACLLALSRLSDADREALLLTAWDGLTPTAAAAVMQCSTATFAVRLHRARRRLSRYLDEAEASPAERAASRPEGRDHR